MERFPAFRIPSDYVGVVQPDGGFVAAEPAIEAQLALAQSRGRGNPDRDEGGLDHAAAQWRARGHRRRRIAADKVIVAAGAWIRRLLPDLPVRLRVTRQVMAWFQPVEAAPFARGRFPVFLIESRHGVHYGFPPHGAEP